MLKKRKKIIIVGAGVAGVDVYNEIVKSAGLGLDVVGFIDDDPKKANFKIGGKKVIGSLKNLSSKIKLYKVKEVIIAIPSAEGEKIAEYVKICNKERVGVRIVPRVKEIIEGKAHVKTLRRVRVEDLLGRPVIKADVLELSKFLKNKTILVTGAAGSIGSELVRQIAAYSPKKLILVDWWENGTFEIEGEIKKYYPRLKVVAVIGNIQDHKKVGSILETYKPDYLFHAAAYKHVPLMEENPEEAIKNNVFGTYNVAKAAYSAGVKKFVIVSTDKASNPRNIMGASKLYTEAIGSYYNFKGKTKFMAVRFGNVLDSYGSVVPIFRKQIEEGGPITITDKKMTRYFMTIPEAAQLILKAASMGNGGELFVLDMGDPVKIVDLAENMIRLSGFIPGEDIEIVYSGIRKGEKIRESLFNKKEKNKLIKTNDKKIFITQSKGMNAEAVLDSLEKLKLFVEVNNTTGIRRELSRRIKSFKA